MIKRLSAERVSPPHERGTALVAVLLLMLMMSGVVATLAVSGHTETILARNHQTAAQARVAAEAGLNHASEVVTAWLLKWKPNGYANVDVAMDALLTTPALLPNITLNTIIEVPGSTTASYRVAVMDEDDAAQRGADATSLDGEEDGIAANDLNRSLVIQAIGYGPNAASAVLETIITPYKLPAIAVDGDMTLGGTSTAILVGANANGGVHANGDLIFSGGAAVAGVPDLLKGTATASGTCDGCTLPSVTSNPTGSGGGRAELLIPSIKASDFREWADRILVADGTSGYITTPGGAILCDAGNSGLSCQMSHGWKYDKNNGEWELTGTEANGFIYYVEGPVKLSAGSVALPVEATIIAEGSITASGGVMKKDADAGDLFMVTDGDLNLSGSFNAAITEGQILVHEQVDIGGNTAILGQIVVENATSTGTPHTNGISGTVAVTNNEDVGSSFFRLSGWREVRR